MVGMGDAPARALIARSWRRAELSGLDPGAAPQDMAVEDVDRGSRLMVAARPVLAEMAAELDGTGFCTILADSAARLVDVRVGQPALQPKLEAVGAAVGRRFVEETTGTNSIATAHELRRGVSVHGDEHFIDSFKQFSCYGHPVLHPVTRRLEGVLDITCLAAHENPLLAPFLRRAAQDIEQRLLADSRQAEKNMLAAYQLCTARTHRPVVVLGDGVTLANPAATDLLEPDDYVALRSAPLVAGTGHRLVLSSGHEARVLASPVDGGRGAVLYELSVGDEHRPAR